jgi:two-component system alkaline phosphatase synthesis response regulator PhoP
MLEDKVILIVDDDLDLLEMYSERFKAEGAIVEIAHNGKEAIKLARENRPHVILLDLMMPEVNGFEVLKTLKGDDSTKDMPIIILTALIEADKYQTAKELGADEYIVKSELVPNEVVEKVKQILAE